MTTQAMVLFNMHLSHKLNTQLTHKIFTWIMLVALSPSAHAAWLWSTEIARGVPSGVIRVRENAVAGTTLSLGPRLGIDSIRHLRFGGLDEISHGHAFVLNVDFARLYGETVLPTPVYFNGVQLAAGKTLTSSASWLENWQVTALYRQRLWGSAAGPRVDGDIGFTYVGLTYSLQGHPSGASNPSELSGSRTSEDFITQELPVPQVGLDFRYPITSSWEIDARIIGGHLPLLYSLRNEGGKVYVTQTDQEARLGVSYHLKKRLQVGFGWYSRYFMQNEQSAEDGNYIRLTGHGLYLSLQYRS